MKQAVILAAGEGQRLRPFTVNRPKVMLGIAGKPVLQYAIEALAANGIRDITLVVGYRKEQVIDFLGSGEELGVALTYITQEQQLGTAHALARARAMVKHDFLVLPGDNLIEPDTIREFAAVSPDALLVKRAQDPQRYGVVVLEGGLVREVVEKPEATKGNLVSTGVYSFHPDIFDFIEPDLDLPDVLNNAIRGGRSIRAVETAATWLDAVYPWDILVLNAAVLERVTDSSSAIIEAGACLKGPVVVGRDTVIRSHTYIVGPAVIGDGCDIGPNVCIFPATTLGDNVVAAPFTHIKNSVVGNDVNIGPGCTIEDSVIDHGCVIQAHFTACCGESEIAVDDHLHRVRVGAMLGEGCRIGNGVVARPGVIVGNYAQIQPLKLIGGRLPDRSLVY